MNARTQENPRTPPETHDVLTVRPIDDLIRVNPLSPAERAYAREMRKPEEDRNEDRLAQLAGALATEKAAVAASYGAQISANSSEGGQEILRREMELNMPGSDARERYFAAQRAEGVDQWQDATLRRLDRPQADFGGLTGMEMAQTLMRRAADRIAATMRAGMSPQEQRRFDEREADFRQMRAGFRRKQAEKP